MPQVFDDVGGGDLLDGKGRSEWEACIASGSAPKAPGDPGYGNRTLDLWEQVRLVLQW